MLVRKSPASVHWQGPKLLIQLATAYESHADCHGLSGKSESETSLARSRPGAFFPGSSAMPHRHPAQGLVRPSSSALLRIPRPGRAGHQELI